MNAGDASSNEPAGRSYAARWSIWIAALLLLHPLSMGPVSYSIGRGWLPDGPNALRTAFFAPEYWICQNRTEWPGLTPVGDALQSYSGFSVTSVQHTHGRRPGLPNERKADTASVENPIGKSAAHRNHRASDSCGTGAACGLTGCALTPVEYGSAASTIATGSIECGSRGETIEIISGEYGRLEETIAQISPECGSGERSIVILDQKCGCRRRTIG